MDAVLLTGLFTAIASLAGAVAAMWQKMNTMRDVFDNRINSLREGHDQEIDRLHKAHLDCERKYAAIHSEVKWLRKNSVKKPGSGVFKPSPGSNPNLDAQNERHPPKTGESNIHNDPY